MIWIYNEEYFNTWVKAHHEWMSKNLPKEMADAFENELESLFTDMDRHGFMFFHLLHMSTLDKGEYMYGEEAQHLWNATLPLMQAFNTLVMGLAGKAGDNKTLHAIGLANALMMGMFKSKDEEE